ncbi:MAG: DUF2628 domain-containing protein [Candidatus Adiutrix sp.]|jgi:hypothetical protein|nr:DUF2628 domain-containing protein [Candidatus Adiutrix sp.]
MTNPELTTEIGPFAEPEPGPAPPASTLAEARAACVGERYPLFEESFELFDAAGGFRPTFTWPPLLFGLLWFIYRRMYVEGAVIFAAGLINAALWAGVQGSIMPAFSLVMALVMALTGRWLYWRAVDRRIERAMLLYPREPDRALGRLKRRGGPDPLTTALTAAGLSALLLFSATGS